jgi:hypothetical protein
MKNKVNLTIIILLFSPFCIAQTSELVGTWNMVKHITTLDNDKNYDCMKHMDGSTEQTKINADGTYERMWTDKKGKKTSTVGMWKLSADNKKLTLYKNSFKPKIPNATIADRTYTVIKLTATEFEFKENLCTEGFEGVSVYRRVK